jgi:hypothetical protein
MLIWLQAFAVDLARLSEVLAAKYRSAGAEAARKSNRVRAG